MNDQGISDAPTGAVREPKATGAEESVKDPADVTIEIGQGLEDLRAGDRIEHGVAVFRVVDASDPLDIETVKERSGVTYRMKAMASGGRVRVVPAGSSDGDQT